MKRWVLAAAVLLLLNGGLLRLLSRLSAERDELEQARSEDRELSEKSRAASEHSRRVSALMDRAAATIPDEPLDVARLRDVLLEAERGLALRRSSLDFRAAPDPAAGVAQSVQVSLSGSFSGIHRYLSRLEGLRWPLVIEEVTIRPASGGGNLVLDLRSTALFERGEGKDDFSPTQVDRLEAWLARRTDEQPIRDVFAEASGRGPPEAEPEELVPGLPPAPESFEPEEPEQLSSPERPQLTGFVLARPELESDVSRRVLAAIRFEGELRLMKVGDVVGGFRVERIDARDSVVLVHEVTGERITLWLE